MASVGKVGRVPEKAAIGVVQNVAASTPKPRPTAQELAARTRGR
jgi:hypothetical protein